MELGKETSLGESKLIPLGELGVVDGTLGELCEFRKLGEIQVDSFIVVIGPLFCFPLNLIIVINHVWRN